MLSITIDNPELESSLKQLYGDNDQAMAKAFSEFLKQQQIKQEVGVAIEQLDAGQGIGFNTAIHEIRAKYE